MNKTNREPSHDPTHDPTIGFIGGGNMATSLIGGILASSTAEILVAEPDPQRREALATRFDIRTTADNREVLHCDSVILATKPQVLAEVCRGLKSAIGDSPPLFISIAAGVPGQSIDRWLGGNQAIIRCMPNTPALLQCGATGFHANERVSEAQKRQAEKILSAIGITVEVDDESLLNAITAVSGSGPAYFFLLMEAMQQTAIELGLDADTSRRLVVQTALGAARMSTEMRDDDGAPLPAATLRQQVTSKGGTTAAAIDRFSAAGFADIVRQALLAANQRSITLASELGDCQQDGNPHGNTDHA